MGAYARLMIVRFRWSYRMRVLWPIKLKQLFCHHTETEPTANWTFSGQMCTRCHKYLNVTHW